MGTQRNPNLPQPFNAIVFLDRKQHNQRQIVRNRALDPMKQFLARFPLFFGFMIVVWAVVGCKTSESEHSQASTVVSMGGEARYWDGQSNKVHVIKNGDQIPPGATIETAKGMGNYVDLAMGKRLPTIYWNYPYAFDPPDSMRVNENSVLKLEKITLRTVGKDRNLDARVHLLQGSISIETLGRWEEPLLQAGVIARNRGKSDWELRSSNCVLHTQGDIIWFSALGLARIFSGTATVEGVTEKTTMHLADGQEYEAVTGNIRLMKVEERLDFILGPELPPPPETQRPRFPVPQRSF